MTRVPEIRHTQVAQRKYLCSRVTMRIETETRFLPRVTKWQVQCVLRWIDPDDLKGLELIKVLDNHPADHEYNRQPAYLRGFFYNGTYLQASTDRPAQVLLYSKEVYFGIPTLLMLSPMAILKLANILAHEIGHHVIATRGFIYEPSEKYKPWDGVRDSYTEKMADAYSLDVSKKMLSRWYYRVGKWLTNGFAKLLYKVGLQNYQTEDFGLSAQLSFKAYLLNPENENAGQCYRHAMEKLRKQVPSPFNESEQEWLRTRYNSKPSKTLGQVTVENKVRAAHEQRRRRSKRR